MFKSTDILYEIATNFEKLSPQSQSPSGLLAILSLLRQRNTAKYTILGLIISNFYDIGSHYQFKPRLNHYIVDKGRLPILKWKDSRFRCHSVKTPQTPSDKLTEN